MLNNLLQWLRLHWPGHEADLLRQYGAAFRGRSDVLRDLALFAEVNAMDVAPERLERVEGRREVFRYIMAMQKLDPIVVAQFLEGDELDG